jgi:PhzF family phenazine biosynthesis protein
VPTYRVYQVDAFTRERFAGNPAGVVPDARGLDEAAMRALARELNNPETAFVGPPDDDSHDARVRFFTPTMEVPVCGHATLAAHFVRAIESGEETGSVRQASPGGAWTVRWTMRDGQPHMTMDQGAVRVGDVLKGAQRAALLDALGIGAPDLPTGLPIEVLSTGHGKIVVPLRSRATLDGLAPDMSALARVSAETQVNGFIVFTLDVEDEEGAAVACRMFGPAMGIPEDAVNGSGQGPLGGYIIRHGMMAANEGALEFTSVMGDSVGRPGRAEVALEVSGREVTRAVVGGDCVVAYHFVLDIDTETSD